MRYLSIDPTIRTWMNDAPGYLPAIGIGDVVRGGGIGEVVATTSDRYQVGDLVFGMTGWQDYTVADEAGRRHAGHPGRDRPAGGAVACSGSRA